MFCSHLIGQFWKIFDLFVEHLLLALAAMLNNVTFRRFTLRLINNHKLIINKLIINKLRWIYCFFFIHTTYCSVFFLDSLFVRVWTHVWCWGIEQRPLAHFRANPIACQHQHGNGRRIKTLLYARSKTRKLMIGIWNILCRLS